jgi:hypothetical protein
MEETYCPDAGLLDSRFDLRDTTDGARRAGVCVGCGADLGLDVWFVFFDSRESRRRRLGVGSATLLSVLNQRVREKRKRQFAPCLTTAKPGMNMTNLVRACLGVCRVDLTLGGGCGCQTIVRHLGNGSAGIYRGEPLHLQLSF